MQVLLLPPIYMPEIMFTCEHCNRTTRTDFDNIYFYTQDVEYYSYEGDVPQEAKAAIDCDNCNKSTQLR